MPEDAVCKEALPAAQREAKLVAATQNEHARELVEAALKFYGLDLPVGNFFVRNDGDGRNMYLASDAVRDVLCASPNLRVMVVSDGIGAPDPNPRHVVVERARHTPGRLHGVRRSVNHE